MIVQPTVSTEWPPTDPKPQGPQRLKTRPRGHSFTAPLKTWWESTPGGLCQSHSQRQPHCTQQCVSDSSPRHGNHSKLQESTSCFPKVWGCCEGQHEPRVLQRFFQTQDWLSPLRFHMHLEKQHFSVPCATLFRCYASDFLPKCMAQLYPRSMSEALVDL